MHDVHNALWVGVPWSQGNVWEFHNDNYEKMIMYGELSP